MRIPAIVVGALGTAVVAAVGSIAGRAGETKSVASLASNLESIRSIPLEIVRRDTIVGTGTEGAICSPYFAAIKEPGKPKTTFFVVRGVVKDLVVMERLEVPTVLIRIKIAADTTVHRSTYFRDEAGKEGVLLEIPKLVYLMAIPCLLPTKMAVPPTVTDRIV